MMPQLRKEQIAAMNIHYRLFPLEYFFKAEQELGMKTIELWGGAPHFLLGYDGYQDCSEVKKMAEDHGLKIVVFTPESAAYPFTLCGWDDEVYKKSLLYFSNAIEVAGKLGAKIMSLSCAGGAKDRDPRYAFERAVASLRKLAPIAADKGITLAVETMCPESSVVVNDLDSLKRLLKAVDHQNVKACVDLCAISVAYETLDQWFNTLGKDIAHIHFTDGRPYGHLVWGEGLHCLDDLIKTLNAHGYNGYLGQNLNVRGMVFDPALVDDEKGYIGKDFVAENYWFNPIAVDAKNMSAFAPYLIN